MPVSKLLPALLLSLFAAGGGASEFSSLEEQMTGSEFNAAGLERLSPEELARLNQWLREKWPRTAASRGPGAAAVPGEDRRGFFESTGGGEDIASRIQGTFTGWNSGSRFELENGMVWEVAETSNFSVRALENPPVTIRRGMFSAWYLRVDGYNSQVRVRRVR